MNKCLIVIVLLLLFNTNTIAQKSTSDRVIYTIGAPSVCVRPFIYVDSITGFAYTFKTGVGCFLIGASSGLEDGGLSNNAISKFDGSNLVNSLLSSTTNVTQSSGQLLLPNGSESLPSFSFSNSTSTGLFLIGSSLNISISGANRWQFSGANIIAQDSGTIDTAGYKLSGTNLSLSTIFSSGNSAGVTAGAGATTFVGILPSGATASSLSGNATESNKHLQIPISCTAYNLFIDTGTAQPGDGALTITLRVASADTALLITVPAGAGAAQFSNTVNSVPITAGQRASIEITNAATTTSAAIVSWAFACR